MEEKEKEVQRALGLEKGFIVHLPVEVPVYVSVPIVVKGFSEEDVRNKIRNLPDKVKQQIILYTCRTIIDHNIYDWGDYKTFGEDAIDEVRVITNTPRKDIAPNIIHNTGIGIEETELSDNSVANVVEHIKNYMELKEDEILII